MYKEKTGPSTELWGTPIVQLVMEDFAAPMRTNWLRGDRYERNQARAVSVMPKQVWSRLRRMLWSMVLNAELRSRNTRSVDVEYCDYKYLLFALFLLSIISISDSNNIWIFVCSICFVCSTTRINFQIYNFEEQISMNPLKFLVTRTSEFKSPEQFLWWPMLKQFFFPINKLWVSSAHDQSNQCFPTYT